MEIGHPSQASLLTGPPGCGKTTVIRRLVEQLGDLRQAGFYTQEIRERGQRVGFEAILKIADPLTVQHVTGQGDRPAPP
jgi:nucleoside-triphosphatase